jgi:hypothetical protein
MRACIRRNTRLALTYHADPQGLVQTENIKTETVAAGQTEFLFQCPEASYLNAQVLDKVAAEKMLRRGYEFATKQLGYRSQNCNREEITPMGPKSTVVKFEDPAWPKPALCRSSICGDHDCALGKEEESVDEIASRNGSDEILFVSLKYGFIFHKVMKAAGSSLLAYLKCNFEVQEITTVPRNAFHLLSSFIHVLPTREPTSRFVSSFRQILSMMYDLDFAAESSYHDTLQSYFHNMSSGPEADHQQDEMVAKERVDAAIRDVGMTEHEAATLFQVEAASLAEWSSTPSVSNSSVWKRASGWLLQRRLEQEYHPELGEKFVAYVNDSLCNHNYFQCNHAETMTHNLGALLIRAWDANKVLRWPAPEVFVFHSSNLKEDMKLFKTMVGYDRERDVCPLEHQNSRRSPATEELKRVIADASNGGALQHQFCYRFLFDFVCLGYELPEGCKWLAKAEVPEKKPANGP